MDRIWQEILQILLKAFMNNKQRKLWDSWIDTVSRMESTVNPHWFSPEILMAANAYIMKLERELQNIKGHKRIAAILKPKMEV